MRIEKELYEKISDITITDYEPMAFYEKEEQYLVSSENVECMLSDLVDEIGFLKEEIKELKNVEID